MRGSWITFLLVCALCGGARAEPALETFFTKHCVECHGPEKQKGKVRLDLGVDALFADADLPGTVVAVLEAGEMPPEDAPQPRAEARAQALEALKKGIKIDGVAYGSILARLESRKGANAWYQIGLSEGKNREIRRVLEHLGLKVSRLIRTGYGPFQLGVLPPRMMDEIYGKVLREQLGKKLAEGVNLPAPRQNRSKS